MFGQGSAVCHFANVPLKAFSRTAEVVLVWSAIVLLQHGCASWILEPQYVHYFDLICTNQFASTLTCEMSTAKNLTEIALLKHMNKLFSNQRT